MDTTKFLSTPSARRATIMDFSTSGRGIFLSTPSARRATRHIGIALQLQEISIHALREEGDLVQAVHSTFALDFYPRPPRGGRRTTAVCLPRVSKFLSTPSARRATRQAFQVQKYYEISIHALREEGDRLFLLPLFRYLLFLSTPSARRATRKIMKTTIDRGISIHALREEGDPGFMVYSSCI